VLGVIRKIATPAVKAATRGEIGHDLTHLPVYEIEKRVIEAFSKDENSAAGVT
jgi:protein required for attachment to host cells